MKSAAKPSGLAAKTPLILQLVRREIEMRYRGSLLGVLWSFLTPLMLLAVFTFVFAVVLKARWGHAETSATQFGLILFAGLTVFNIFSDTISRAPTLITSQPNLVKKVIFPLELLPIVTLGAALFHGAISAFVLGAFQFLFGDGLSATALLVPVLVAPLALFTLGVAWLFAALGVYVRDIGQIMAPIVTALMFLSPIFYPTSALPEWIRPVAAYNPLAIAIEQTRDAVLFGRGPDVLLWALATAAGAAAAALGYAFFQKTRKGFADVL